MERISDLLKKKRLDRDLTLENIARETKIKKEFLHAIEEGNFQSLPSENYALGFVKNYSKFLGIPLTKAMPLFRREHKSKHSMSIVPEFRETASRFNKKLFLNSRTFVVALIVSVFAIYVFFQYSSLVFAPKLTITNPQDGSTVKTNVVEVSGKTDPYAQVSVNGEEVYVSLSGTFRKSIYSFSGNNEIEIIAKNRFGKESRREINIKVK